MSEVAPVDALSNTHKRPLCARDADEPLLMENKSRFVLFPISYQYDHHPHSLTNCSIKSLTHTRSY